MLEILQKILNNFKTLFVPHYLRLWPVGFRARFDFDIDGKRLDSGESLGLFF